MEIEPIAPLLKTTTYPKKWEGCEFEIQMDEMSVYQALGALVIWHAGHHLSFVNAVRSIWSAELRVLKCRGQTGTAHQRRHFSCFVLVQVPMRFWRTTTPQLF